MTSTSSLQLFPALQAKMGDWYYYLTTLPLSEVAERVRPAGELITPPDMNSWIQREVIPLRISQIADYLIKQEQHFFPTIVVGVYLGEPTWHEVNVEDNAIFGTPALDPRSKYTLGLLELDGTELLYAIDGQHRVAGIREALKRLTKDEDVEGYNRLAQEDLSVVFVSADIEEEGQLERVRRLFTTLNKEAKKVSEPEIVALDEDDAAAIVTRWMAIHYPGLRGDTSTGNEAGPNLIQMGRHEIPPSNRRSVTTIVTLYRMVKSIFQSELQAISRDYNYSRPEDKVLEGLYEETVAIWELMRQNDGALADVLGSDPSEERAMKYRGDHGGHILFRPMGLQTFAGALGLLRKRKVPTEQAVKSLCRLPMDIAQPPWLQIVWNPSTRRIINGNRTIWEALFLHMVGHKPRSSRVDLAKRYRELLGIPDGDPLQDVQVNVLR